MAFWVPQRDINSPSCIRIGCFAQEQLAIVVPGGALVPNYEEPGTSPAASWHMQGSVLRPPALPACGRDDGWVCNRCRSKTAAAT